MIRLMVYAKRLCAALACLALLGGAGYAPAEAGAAAASASTAQRARPRQARRAARRRSVKKMDARDVKGTGQVEAGVWGGRGIQLAVGEGGARVEYDCAHGEIAGPVALDAEGRFSLGGTLTPERGGPAHAGESPKSFPARYEGRVSGQTMTLTVTRADTGERVGTYTLTRGAEARLFKCL